jgi:hypothetical protein
LKRREDDRQHIEFQEWRLRERENEREGEQMLAETAARLLNKETLGKVRSREEAQQNAREPRESNDRLIE